MSKTNMPAERIAILTFLRFDELPDQSFFDLLIHQKRLGREISAYLFADSADHIPCEFLAVFSDVVISPGTTKFTRLSQAFKSFTVDVFVCVDSDIRIDIERTSVVLDVFVNENYDVGWGRISCHSVSGVVPSLVYIDKILSHCYLRPLLWKSGVAITIPGQLMLLRKRFFQDSFNTSDTFLDDVAFGLFVRSKSKTARILASSHCLGNENPARSLTELTRQRHRWAKGYASLVWDTRHSASLAYVLVHGFSYHVALILITAIMLSTLAFQPLAMLFAWLLLAFILCKGDIRFLAYALAYPIVFSLLHIFWGTCVMRSLLGMYQNNSNKHKGKHP